MSKFISPNDIRIASTVTSSNPNQLSDILSESFYNPQSHQITSMVMNYNHDHNYLIRVTQHATEFEFDMPSWSTVVFQWTEE